jgi:hypothetical protein
VSDEKGTATTAGATSGGIHDAMAPSSVEFQREKERDPRDTPGVAGAADPPTREERPPLVQSRVQLCSISGSTP